MTPEKIVIADGIVSGEKCDVKAIIGTDDIEVLRTGKGYDRPFFATVEYEEYVDRNGDECTAFESVRLWWNADGDDESRQLKMQSRHGEHVVLTASPKRCREVGSMSYIGYLLTKLAWKYDALLGGVNAEDDDRERTC